MIFTFAAIKPPSENFLLTAGIVSKLHLPFYFFFVKSQKLLDQIFLFVRLHRAFLLGFEYIAVPLNWTFIISMFQS